METQREDDENTGPIGSPPINGETVTGGDGAGRAGARDRNGGSGVDGTKRRKTHRETSNPTSRSRSGNPQTRMLLV
jgi:hypothetical protein